MSETLTGFIHRWYKILVVLCVLAVAFLAYYIGFIEGKEGAQSRVALLCDKDVLSTLAIPLGAVANASQKSETSSTIKNTTTQNIKVSNTVAQNGGVYMGSKNGKKYYTTGCASTKRIKSQNQIYFKDAQDAQLQGYTRGSC
jgi:hypothetical protein